ncbi:MAG: PIN domain-containing protein [Planctomycetota bacterium]
MIYVDTSVVLAWILAEDRRPPASLWRDLVVSSRLLVYETWTRLHAYGMTPEREEAAREVVSFLALVELAPPVLGRALEPFPGSVRTLDALHLATLDHLAGRGASIALASYDERLAAAARALGHRLHPLP